jgi:hypothetical protein
MSFKENWEKTDEKCLTCGNVTKHYKGITRENMKRLSSFKITGTEIIIFTLMIGMVFLVLFWKSDTDACRNWIQPMINTTLLKCESVCNQKCEMIYQNEEINLTNATKYIENITIK